MKTKEEMMQLETAIITAEQSSAGFRHPTDTKKDEADELNALDEKMKAKGCKYRLTAWIHAGGDDKCIDIYYPTKPTKKDIQKELKRSVVKDDYKLKKL